MNPAKIPSVFCVNGRLEDSVLDTRAVQILYKKFTSQEGMSHEKALDRLGQINSSVRKRMIEMRQSLPEDRSQLLHEDRIYIQEMLSKYSMPLPSRTSRQLRFDSDNPEYSLDDLDGRAFKEAGFHIVRPNSV